MVALHNLKGLWSEYGAVCVSSVFCSVWYYTACPAICGVAPIGKLEALEYSLQLNQSSITSIFSHAPASCFGHFNLSPQHWRMFQVQAFLIPRKLPPPLHPSFHSPRGGRLHLSSELL